MNRTFIIAEIGCNHNGDFRLAEKMIDEAAFAGVDAVKFQIFNAKELISKYAEKADYQKETTGMDETQLEMTEKLELEHDNYIKLKRIAEQKGLKVFATPFDLQSIDFLADIGQTLWKIPSGEITNLPYLEKINNLQIKDKQIILSTGMATISEIKECLNVLKDCKNITLLHCNTEYPTPDEDVNLYAIEDLRRKFPQFHIGFSDHSIGTTAAIGAAVLGVSMIEKHFTLDKNMVGPDHKASATPEELRELCAEVRRIETMKGDKKIVTNSEEKNKKIARKSIVAKSFIKKGTSLTEDNITCKRPGNGISPMMWYDVLGRKAEQDFCEDELITFKNIKNQE